MHANLMLKKFSPNTACRGRISAACDRFDNEVGIETLGGMPGIMVEHIKPLVNRFFFPLHDEN